MSDFLLPITQQLAPSNQKDQSLEEGTVVHLTFRPNAVKNCPPNIMEVAACAFFSCISLCLIDQSAA
jgi:hypothetical protein